MTRSLSGEPPSSGAPSPRWRVLLTFMFKALVTVGLVAWLIRSGSLDMKELRILVSSPTVIMVTIATWLSMSVGLTTWRWRIFLRAAGTPVSVARGAALQTTALFFNGLVPGNVGGDFVKNQAVLGNQAGRLVVMVVVERTVGLISLVWAGGLGLLLSFGTLTRQPRLIPVALALSLLMIGSVVGPWLLVVVSNRVPREALSRTTRGGLVLALWRGISRAAEAFRWIFECKRALVSGLGISLVMHIGNIAYFLFLARYLGNPTAQYSDIAMVFPLGMLSLVIPVSISGFGVGHVMFNELFLALGLSSGANVFNAYIVAQLSLCLFGAVPYVFARGVKQSSLSMR